MIKRYIKRFAYIISRMTSVQRREYPRCYISSLPLNPLRRLGDPDRYVFPQQVQQATGGPECVKSVASKKFLMLIKQCIAESVDDFHPIFFPKSENLKGFQPNLFFNRPLPYDQRYNLFLPISICHQGPEAL